MSLNAKYCAPYSVPCAKVRDENVEVARKKLVRKLFSPKKLAKKLIPKSCGQEKFGPKNFDRNKIGPEKMVQKIERGRGS